MLIYSAFFFLNAQNIFPENGNVGIGTNTPTQKLEVNGYIKSHRLHVSDGSAIGHFFTYGGNQNLYIGAGKDSLGAKNDIIIYNYACADGCNVPSIQLLGDIVYAPKKLGIGNLAPMYTLDVNGTFRVKNEGAELLIFKDNTIPNFIALRANTGNGIIFQGQPDIPSLSISGINNRVGIGTTTPDAELTVKGNIHAEEVRVDLSVPGPDYVFKTGYDLIALEALQNYINTHGHLPNIPSAEKMQKNGIELSRMNMKLLEKIEELTLYTLQQEKVLKEQQHINKNMEIRLTCLEQQLSRIE